MGPATSKRTYENMSALHRAAGDDDTRRALVSMWRARSYGHDTRRVERDMATLIGSLWGDLVYVTHPTTELLTRWERDHGYVAR